MKRIHIERVEANWLRVLVGALGVAGVMIAGTARAQFTGSYQTNIISATFSSWSGDYNVGNNTVFDQLQIISGGVLSNNGYGEIGLTASASNNSVLVTGAGSLWNNTNTLFVGDGGSGNSLTVANGGRVVNTYGYIGNGVNAANNTVLVTGTGSIWSNSLNLYVGVTGSRNSLTISNGGQVFNHDGQIGLDPKACNNSVQVSGLGSLWNNSSGMFVGIDGSSNSLTIVNGGQVVNANGYVGLLSDSSNNSVLVAGAGSLWNTANMIFVGYSGSGNQVSVGAGGSVLASDVCVGFNPSSVGNQITVSGGALYVTNALANGVLDVRRGTLTLNSGTVTVDNLIATSGSSSVIQFNGGTLNTKGTSINNGSPFTVGNGSSTATLNLQGGTHSFANGLVISQHAVLEGTGMIQANLTLAGTLAPGNSAGAITNFGNLSLQSSAVLQLELGGTAQGSEYDFVLVNGEVTLGGSLQVSFINGFETNVLNSETFTLLTGTNALGGSFANVLSGERLTTADGAGSFLVSYGGNNLVLSDYQVIPEPGTWALCALGLAGLFVARRQRVRSSG